MVAWQAGRTNSVWRYVNARAIAPRLQFSIGGAQKGQFRPNKASKKSLSIILDLIYREIRSTLLTGSGESNPSSTIKSF
jgi:hypothetical protein